MPANPPKRPEIPTDYATRDPRAIPAQLRGRGDGREKDWLAFRDYILKSRPELDDAEITELYAVFVRDQTSGT